jgi:hypothetical protein
MRPHWATVDFIRRLRDMNLPVYTHPINCPEEWREQRIRGVQGIYTGVLVS